MASNEGTVSDEQRSQLEEEIAAALLLIYGGRRQQALAQLGQQVAAADIPLAAQQKILAFAEDRARLIQEGVNSRMAGADDPVQMQQDIADYNSTVLQPFMDSWAQHQALVDSYEETPGKDGGTAADDTLWEWQQYSDFQDDCTEAAGMGPSKLAELYAATGGPPPAHPRCRCSLNPV